MIEEINDLLMKDIEVLLDFKKLEKIVNNPNCIFEIIDIASKYIDIQLNCSENFFKETINRIISLYQLVM